MSVDVKINCIRKKLHFFRRNFSRIFIIAMESSKNATSSREPNSREVRQAEIKKVLEVSLKVELELICSELKIIGVGKFRKSKIVEVLLEHSQKNEQLHT